MKLDTEARYAKSHEWVRKDETSTSAASPTTLSTPRRHRVRRAPESRGILAAGASFGVVESVKAASDLYLPIGGKISAANPSLAEAPDMVNKDCYGEGWMVRILPADPAAAAAEWAALMSAADYEKIAEEE
jgi:glycine cleavage system H protein